MTTDVQMETVLPANAGDSQHSSISTSSDAERDNLNCGLLIKAQEMAHLGTWVVSMNPDTPGVGEQAMWSNEMFRMLGFAPGAFNPTFEGFLATVHPDDRARVSAVVTEAIKNAVPYQFDYRVATRDGRLQVFHGCGSFELDDRGRIVRILGTCTDITERFRAQRELEESANRLRAVFDQSAVGMAVVEQDGTILQVNRSFARFLGYDVAELQWDPLESTCRHASLSIL